MVTVHCKVKPKEALIASVEIFCRTNSGKDGVHLWRNGGTSLGAAASPKDQRQWTCSPAAADLDAPEVYQYIMVTIVHTKIPVFVY